jgi:hypothetical protein
MKSSRQIVSMCAYCVLFRESRRANISRSVFALALHSPVSRALAVMDLFTCTSRPINYAPYVVVH